MLKALTKDDMIDEAQRLLGDRKLLLVSHFGSGLYGTSTPDSDTDIRVVFLPTNREILLGEVDFTVDSNPESQKLGQGDVDITGYSLMRFLDMLGRFDMTAVEMLYASRDAHNYLSKDPVVDWILNSRTALIGSHRSGAIRQVRANLGALLPDDDDYSRVFGDVVSKLGSLNAQTPLITHIDALDDLRSDPQMDFLVRGPDGDLTGDAALEVILEEERPKFTTYFFTLRGRKIDMTLDTQHLLDICQSVLAQKSKAEAKRLGVDGSDTKKVYHAIRVLDQVIELAADDALTFPREIAPLLMQIRKGELDESGLRKITNLYFQTGLAADEDLPFNKTRCLETFEEIVTRTHLNALQEDGAPF